MELQSSEKFIEEPISIAETEFNNREEITEDQTHVQEIQIQNEQRETVETNQLENEIQDQTVYKPRHVDTETLIKGEIKQVIFSEVSELTSAIALNDMSFDLKGQATSLREHAVQLQSKNEKLVKQVETSTKRLQRLEAFLLQTNEMIEMMKLNVGNLEKQIKKSHIHEILLKSEKQYAQLQSIKATYETKFRTESGKIENMLSAEREHNRSLKSELKREEENLADFKNKYEELRKTNKFYDEEIATYSAKLEELANLKSKKISNPKILPNTDAIRENLIQKFLLKKDNLRTNLANVEKQKRESERQLEDSVNEINVLKNDINKGHQQILQKESELKELLEQLEITKQEQEATIRTLKQEDEDFTCRLQELESDLVFVKKGSEERQEMLRTLQTNYVSKCEEKSLLLDQWLKLQQTVHNLELIFTKEQLENDIKRAQFEKLKNERDTLLDTFKLAEANKVKEETALSEKLSDLTTKYELLKPEQDKYLLEIKKKKEYKLTTSRYFEEKCGSLRQQMDKLENALKNLNQENESLKIAVGEKQTLINDLKRKLQTSNKNDERVSRKSGLKSLVKENRVTKKVKFNEIPFFKSATESSEASSQALTEGASQLERSIDEWLGDAVQTVSPEK